jgi:hypothetical protein
MREFLLKQKLREWDLDPQSGAYESLDWRIIYSTSLLADVRHMQFYLGTHTPAPVG